MMDLGKLIEDWVALMEAKSDFVEGEDEDEPFEEGVLSSIAGFEYEIERVLYYDVNKRDLSDFQELAAAIGF